VVRHIPSPQTSRERGGGGTYPPRKISGWSKRKNSRAKINNHLRQDQGRSFRIVASKKKGESNFNATIKVPLVTGTRTKDANLTKVKQTDAKKRGLWRHTRVTFKLHPT